MSEAELDLARVICALHELDDPGARGFAMGRGDWPLRGFVVRRGAELRAYVNHCPHAGHQLNLQPHAFLAPGRPLIMCSSHGALFEMESGLCVAGPCPGARLRASRCASPRVMCCSPTTWSSPSPRTWAADPDRTGAC